MNSMSPESLSARALADGIEVKVLAEYDTKPLPLPSSPTEPKLMLTAGSKQNVLHDLR